MSDLHRTELRLERNRKCYLDKKANAIWSNQASYWLLYVEAMWKIQVILWSNIIFASHVPLSSFHRNQRGHRCWCCIRISLDYSRHKTQNSICSSLFLNLLYFFIDLRSAHPTRMKRPKQKLLKREEIRHLLWGFFHLQINTDLLHQDGVCRTDLTLTTVPVFTIIKEVVNLFHSVAHWCVFTIELCGTEE